MSETTPALAAGDSRVNLVGRLSCGRPAALVAASVAAAFLLAGCGASTTATSPPVASGAPTTSQQSATPPSGTGTTSPTQGATSKAAPAGTTLAGIAPSALPSNQAQVDALLARLPQRLSGADRRTPTRNDIGWTDGSTLITSTVSDATGSGAAMSTREFFESFVNKGGFTVTERSAPGSNLLWFVGTSTDGKNQSSATVADADGQWLYGFQAPNAEALNELVAQVKAALS